MAEVLPVVAGLLLGAFAVRCVGRVRLLVVAVGSVPIAIFAGLVSGELARSAGFLLVDWPEALVASFAGAVVASGLRGGWAAE